MGRVKLTPLQAARMRRGGPTAEAVGPANAIALLQVVVR